VVPVLQLAGRVLACLVLLLACLVLLLACLVLLLPECLAMAQVPRQPCLVVPWDRVRCLSEDLPVQLLAG
jgi:hypothetical protein